MVSTSPGTAQRSRVALRMQQAQAAHVQRLASLLAAFFARQAIRVIQRWRMASTPVVKRSVALEQKQADANELLPDQERRFLQALILPILSEQFLTSADLAGDMVGVEDPLTSEDPRTLRFLADAGARITDIHEVTVVAVRDALQAGHLAGYSDYQIAHGVPADGYRGIQDVVVETYHGRAEAIARTEVAIASQTGAHARYQESGVSMVELVDGDGCGFTSHDDPDLAHGSIRTLIEADQYPISHPRCVRVSLPVLE